jgi:putative hydrolase of HD superfamily
MAKRPVERVLDLLLEANRLKSIPRGGWAMRGVAAAESVADHSFGAALLALILADRVDEPLDRARILTMALLHDLPEARLSDIPKPALRYFPAQAKHEAELVVMTELLGEIEGSETLRACWLEFEQRRSREALLVHDADRLELLLQATVYEQTRGNRNLGDFWQRLGEDSFHFPASVALYRALQARRRSD